jgi:hypothetical protein
MDALPHLPDDVLVEILVRLPGRYIAGCRAVCKAWRSAIAHPIFDHVHAQRPAAVAKVAAHRQIEYCVGRSGILLDRPLTRVFVFDYLHGGRERRPFPRALWFTVPMHTAVRGSWDGVLCLERGDCFPQSPSVVIVEGDHYVLWNPLTMACATVGTPVPGGRIIGGYTHPKTRRFHLLHAIGENDHCVCHIRPTIFRILRVGDAAWREVPMEDSSADPLTPMIMMLGSLFRTPHVVRLHNNLHWLVQPTTGSGTAVRLLVFDTTHERFWSMKAPERHGSGRPLCLMTTRIGVLPRGQMLCVFAVDPWSSTMEMWVLDDYCGAGPSGSGSWRLRERISLISWDGADLSRRFYTDAEVVVAEDARDGEEEVFFKPSDGRLDAYRFRRKAWRTVDLVLDTPVDSEHLVVHGESLLQGQVSFGNANRPLRKYVDRCGQRLYCL